jgi:hypothetical protein
LLGLDKSLLTVFDHLSMKLFKARNLREHLEQASAGKQQKKKKKKPPNKVQRTWNCCSTKRFRNLSISSALSCRFWRDKTAIHIISTDIRACESNIQMRAKSKRNLGFQKRFQLHQLSKKASVNRTKF